MAERLLAEATIEDLIHDTNLLADMRDAERGRIEHGATVTVRADAMREAARISKEIQRIMLEVQRRRARTGTHTAEPV
jgi:hypothetical protein